MSVPESLVVRFYLRGIIVGFNFINDQLLQGLGVSADYTRFSVLAARHTDKQFPKLKPGQSVSSHVKLRILRLLEICADKESVNDLHGEIALYHLRFCDKARHIHHADRRVGARTRDINEDLL